MRRLHRRGSVALLIAALVGACVLVGPGAALAAAGTTNCGIPRWQLLDHDYPVRSIDWYGRHLVLENLQIADYSYAKITSGYRSGDRVWVDRSSNGGGSWFQCGPFSDYRSRMLDNLHYWMRACLDVVVSGQRRHACTSWYYDAS
jgi:hypothetical protein